MSNVVDVLLDDVIGLGAIKRLEKPTIRWPTVPTDRNDKVGMGIYWAQIEKYVKSLQVVLQQHYYRGVSALKQ